MAEPTINDRVAKQKAEAEKRKKAQASAGGGVPTSPFGIANQGANEDQAKMAGTPAAMGSSIADQTGEAPPQGEEETTLGQAATQAQEDAGIPQDESLQTELGEKSFDDAQRDAAQERAKAFSDKMETFGSLGQRVENMVTGAFSGVTAGGDLKNLAADVGFEIGDVTGLMADGTSEADMKSLLTDFSQLGRTDANAAFKLLVEKQGMFKNPSSGIMAFVDKAYAKDPETMHKTVANLVANDIIDPDQVNFEHLISSGFVNIDENGTIVELGITTDELQEILGDEWKTMTPEQIGEEVESKREDVLANQEKIEEQLSDPNLPPQTRVALLDELQRMGAIGAIEYEQRAVEAQTEAADSGKIMIGGEVQDVAELLKDENIKKDVMNFLSDPESAENKEWARINPEFADWLGRELESLNITKDTLEGNISNFEGIQKENESFVESNLSSQGGKVSSDIMKLLGYGDQGFEMEKYSAGDDPIYNMLEGLSDGDQTAQAVGILNDLPKNQLAQLKGLPADKLKDLLTNPDKMQEFATIAKMKDKWENAQNSGNVGTMANVLLGGAPGGMAGADQVKARMSSLFAQMQFGGNPEIKKQYELMKTVFDQDGDGHIDDPQKVKDAINNLLNEEGDLKSMVEGGLGGRISDFRRMGEAPGVGGIYDTIKGALGPDDTTITNEDLDKLSGQINLRTLEQLLDGKLSAFGVDRNKVRSLMQDKANKAVKDLTTSNLIDLDSFSTTDNVVNFNGPNVKEFGNIRDKLQSAIDSGHPLEKDAAIEQMRKLRNKTVEPRPFGSWQDVKDHNNAMREAHINESDIPAEWKDAFTNQQGGNIGPWKLQHVDTTGGKNEKHQALISRWATWSNYAKDKNDLKSFFQDLAGKDDYQTTREKEGQERSRKIGRRMFGMGGLR